MRRLVSLVFAAFAAAAPLAVSAQEAPPPPQGEESEIVVPGVIERPVPTPPGDARSPEQRMRDIRAWDRCVIRAQGIADSDPTRYQAETPEELCRRSLGMNDRLSIPASRD